MNIKKAKALRKEVGFHPHKSPRKYDAQMITDALGRINRIHSTKVNDYVTPRAKYLEAKKSAK